MRRALLLALLLAAPAAAQDLPDLPDLGDLPEPTRYLAGYVSGGLGWSRPFGGHWGDKSTGFKTAQSFSFAVSKRVDELASYGVESFYGPAYANNGVDGLSLRIISLTPFLKASFPEGNKVFYGIFGAGLYQWRQAPYTVSGVRKGSDSGSSGGLNFGGGVLYPFWFGTTAGLDLRWHHIFNLNGANLDLGSANNMNLMLTVQYGVWRDKKTPVPSP